MNLPVNMKGNEDQLKSVNTGKKKCACRVYGNSSFKNLQVL